ENAVLSKISDYKFEKRFLVPLIISWIVFFCYRYVYFWILIIWAFFYLYMKYSHGFRKKVFNY
ncbi:MAG: hypothetical protein ACFE8P_12080, partial [Promethearchaeota archaeon]